MAVGADRVDVALASFGRSVVEPIEHQVSAVGRPAGRVIPETRPRLRELLGVATVSVRHPDRHRQMAEVRTVRPLERDTGAVG